MDPLFLFDISAYLHRAMYVVYGDRCAEIDPKDTSFIKHACGMLSNTMMALNVKQMAVACDSTEPSLRCDEYPQYKAERKAHYPVFAAQTPRFIDALRDISVPVLAEPRYEADDLIATMLPGGPPWPYAGILDDPGGYVIVSSDKDLLANLDDGGRVRFYDPMKGWVDPGKVREKFGIDPTQLYDYTGLVGDTADGIPGVPGIGAKTAAKLLCEFDSLDELYSDECRVALGEVLGKKKLATLLDHKTDAFLSRRLAYPRICKTLFDKTHPDQTEEICFDAPDPGIVRRACG